MVNLNVIKVVNIVATVASIGAGLASQWVSGKAMDHKIQDGIQKALTEATKNGAQL